MTTDQRTGARPEETRAPHADLAVEMAPAVTRINWARRSRPNAVSA